MTNSTPPPSPRPQLPDADPGDQHAPDERPAASARPRTLDLSLSQIIGGALAAMTAAALGSRLGVAGTIVGAALASIVAGVAGSLYTASLRRTREKVKTVWSGRVAGTDSPATVQLVSRRGAARGPAARPSRRTPWWTMLAATVTILVVAVVALTGFETLAGAALSGGRGTTIEQVVKHRTTTKKPSTTKSTHKPSSKDSATTSAPSRSATSSASSAPTSTTTTDQPSASAKATDSTPPKTTAPQTTAPQTSAPKTTAPGTGATEGSRGSDSKSTASGKDSSAG